ncbi:uncharacterized protein LOC141666280 [Apium graveolens]|uniref:uncharacterized protein LOC141666280 n=1 Tax=Apium graveolens TaxID=4045 RepID=UPI003D7AFB58
MVSKLFKARYYPKGNFLAAATGNNPSYVWRSICEAKPLLISGVRCLVGSGESISIKNQPWLYDAANPYITSDSPTFENNTVASFICNSHEWDEEIIKDLFNERDQRCILRIALVNHREVDSVYWSKENSGVYFVKSAYKMLQDQKGRWRTEDASSLWCKLWKIKAPPKALNLVWRALEGCLPIMTMLVHKHVPVLSTCPAQSSEFAGWLEKVLENSSPNNRAMVVMLCWVIWRARNDKPLNYKQSSMNNVLVLAKQYLVK